MVDETINEWLIKDLNFQLVVIHLVLLSIYINLYTKQCEKKFDRKILTFSLWGIFETDIFWLLKYLKLFKIIIKLNWIKIIIKLLNKIILTCEIFKIIIN